MLQAPADTDSNLSSVFFLSQPVLAAGTDVFAVPEVKVGMVEYPGYAFKDENGNLTGADVEYAYRIAQYANLRFKIVLLSQYQRHLLASG
jgi:ABC-type amino acid transport substrate-binding protein